MKAFIAEHGIEGLLALVMLLNTVLSGVSSFLDWLKGLMNSEAETKFQAFLHSLVDGLRKFIDVISSNREH